jgi:four helix bundle protein
MVTRNPEESGIRSYKDLLVWQRSMHMGLAIYAVTEAFPVRERFGLSAQMRRAAISVPSNIAEGHARGTRSYLQFLLVASGSNAELDTQLILARALKMGDPQKLDEASQLSAEVGKLLGALISRLRQKIS